MIERSLGQPWCWYRALVSQPLTNRDVINFPVQGSVAKIPRGSESMSLISCRVNLNNLKITGIRITGSLDPMAVHSSCGVTTGLSDLGIS